MGQRRPTRTLVLPSLFLFAVVSALETNQVPHRPFGECGTNDTYSPVLLTCKPCGEGAGPDGGPSPAACACLPGYHAIQDTGYYLKDRQSQRGLQCKRCPPGKVTSADGRMCLGCDGGAADGTACRPCPRGHIRIERDQAGLLLPSVRCLECSPGTRPDEEGKACVPCVHLPLLPDHNVKPDCSCTLRSGLCLPNNLDMADIFIETPDAFRIKYTDTREVDSRYLKDHLTSSAYACGRLLNATACQQLANLCALVLHQKDHPACRALANAARDGFLKMS